MTIPSHGQIALFLKEIPEFEALPPFAGVVRVLTSSQSGLAVTGLFGRYNERGEFLITTAPTRDETASASITELVFPHLAHGAGCTTRFILFPFPHGPYSAGSLAFFSQSGEPLNLPINP